MFFNLFIMFLRNVLSQFFIVKSIITQMIIREKQVPYEKCRFCLFVSNRHVSMKIDAQSADHMLNRNLMRNR